MAIENWPYDIMSFICFLHCYTELKASSLQCTISIRQLTRQLSRDRDDRGRLQKLFWRSPSACFPFPDICRTPAPCPPCNEAGRDPGRPEPTRTCPTTEQQQSQQVWVFDSSTQTRRWVYKPIKEQRLAIYIIWEWLSPAGLGPYRVMSIRLVIIFCGLKVTGWWIFLSGTASAYLLFISVGPTLIL